MESLKVLSVRTVWLCSSTISEPSFDSLITGWLLCQQTKALIRLHDSFRREMDASGRAPHVLLGHVWREVVKNKKFLTAAKSTRNIYWTSELLWLKTHFETADMKQKRIEKTMKPVAVIFQVKIVCQSYGRHRESPSRVACWWTNKVGSDTWLPMTRLCVCSVHLTLFKPSTCQSGIKAVIHSVFLK